MGQKWPLSRENGRLRSTRSDRGLPPLRKLSRSFGSHGGSHETRSTVRNTLSALGPDLLEPAVTDEDLFALLDGLDADGATVVSSDIVSAG